jgi:uncharacterized paraquat-inducible protein A
MSWRDVDDEEEDDDESIVDRDEFPDDADADEDEDAVGEDACPYCRALISEDAVRCPRCGHYLSNEDAPPRKSPWVVVTVIVLLAAILVVWVFHGF